MSNRTYLKNVSIVIFTITFRLWVNTVPIFFKKTYQRMPVLVPAVLMMKLDPMVVK